MQKIVYGDNFEYLRDFVADDTFDMVYLDPPFNTGKKISHSRVEAKLDSTGYIGFGDETYKRNKISETLSYNDDRANWLSFMYDRLCQIRRVMKPTALMYLHLDYRSVHYARLICDEIFGEENYVNEIIWAYEWGGKSKKKWPNKHDNILVYSKTEDYYFDLQAAGRLPYMTPNLVGEEKAKLGKTMTDVHWVSIENTNSPLRMGYPTTKPYKLLERFLLASTKEADVVLDPFAGSGMFGKVAKDNNRGFTLIDDNSEAIEIQNKLLNIYDVDIYPVENIV